MDKFYIDRQFGQAIFIDVKNGIVQKCYNESETYKGKSISFLKTDFEERMKPCYYNVRSLFVYSIHQKINTVKSKIKNIYNLIGSLDIKSSRIPMLRAIIKEYTIEQVAYRARKNDK